MNNIKKMIHKGKKRKIFLGLLFIWLGNALFSLHANENFDTFNRDPEHIYTGYHDEAKNDFKLTTVVTTITPEAVKIADKDYYLAQTQAGRWVFLELADGKKIVERLAVDEVGTLSKPYQVIGMQRKINHTTKTLAKFSSYQDELNIYSALSVDYFNTSKQVLFTFAISALLIGISIIGYLVILCWKNRKMLQTLKTIYPELQTDLDLLSTNALYIDAVLGVIFYQKHLIFTKKRLRYFEADTITWINEDIKDGYLPELIARIYFSFYQFDLRVVQVHQKIQQEIKKEYVLKQGICPRKIGEHLSLFFKALDKYYPHIQFPPRNG